MPTINCTEFSRQLAEAVERRQSVDSAPLREHVSECAECRSAWLDALLIDRAVARWKKPPAPAGLTERILSHVASAPVASDAALESTRVVPAKQDVDSRPVPAGRRWNPVAGTLIAALTLGIVSMVYFGRPARQPILQQPEVAQNTRTIAAASAPAAKSDASRELKPTSAPAAPVELMVADAGSAYLHLAGNAAKAVRAAAVLVPAADPVDDAPPPKAQEPWGNDVSREIAPVTHQLSHAFEFLIQAVPEKRAPAT